MHHVHAEQSLNRVAFSATWHCLTGCAVGEVLGVAIGTALGWGNAETIALAIALAFFFGYAFTAVPLLRSGFALGAAAGVALAQTGLAPWTAVLALAVLAARAFALLVFPRPALRARTIGMIEAGLGAAFVLMVALSWNA